jgi:hypothetical protein
MMKTKFFNLRNLITVIITGLILSSCSKDSTTTNDLIGTWNTQSSTFTATINGKTMTQYFMDDMGLTADEAQLAIGMFNTQMQQTFTGTIQMKSDNTYTSTMGGTTDTGTWSLSSDGKKITLDAGTEGSTILDVIELTPSKLHVSGTETTTDDLNADGIQDTMVVTIDLTLTK